MKRNMRTYDYTRRNFLKAVCLGTASLAMQGCVSDSQQPGGKGIRPNILFFFTDDQRYNTLNALNNAEIITPNMDTLVRKGTSFTRAYIMGSMSGAVCIPSRAKLMTGRTLFHLSGDGRNIPQEHVTLPETLQEAGYATFGTGKWHNDVSAYARSFTHGGKIFFGGMSDHLKVPVYDFNPAGTYPKEKRYIGEKFSSELFSDAAIKFLREYKDDNPFLVYVSYTAPHDPRMAQKKYRDMYNPDKISLPKNFMSEHPFDNGDLKIRDEELAPWPRTPDIVREHIADYYAMITHLDEQIGRVLKTLEESGKSDNTIIIFAGDNGLAVGQHGLFGKQNLYEHSVHVPLIISGPGLPQGKTCDAFCYLLDIFPTVCELVGSPIPETVEGKSLVPLITGEKKKVRDSIFGAYKEFQRMVRNDRWKLIIYNVNGKQTMQLFDLQNDPWEMKNLAGDTAQAGRIKELTTLLKKWMKETGDNCDLNKPNWGYVPNEK